METALPVDNVPYDSTVEETGDVSNMTAEEYLSWVRDQSSRMPAYFRASNVQKIEATPQTKYMPQVQDVPTCPVDLLPSNDWERNMIHDFSELRIMMYRKSLLDSTKERKVAVPQMKDRAAWLAFCLGIKDSQNIVSPNESQCNSGDWKQELAQDDTQEGDQKAMRKRKRELAKSLGIAVELECDEEEEGELQDDDESIEVVPEQRVEHTSDQTSDNEGEKESDEEDTPQYHIWEGPYSVNPSLSLLLQFDQVLTQKLLAILIDYLDGEQEEGGTFPELTENCGQWLYSLLARVEKPLHRDVVASIRQLYRRCCILRNELPGKHQHQLNDAFQQQLAALNMLISITGYYFGQGEYYAAFEPIVEAEYKADGTAIPKNLLLEGSSESESDSGECWEDGMSGAMEEEAGQEEEDDEDLPSKRRAL